MRFGFFSPRTRILLAVLMLLIVGAVQGTGYFSVLGVQPNLILVTLIIFSLFIQTLPNYLLLVLLGAISIQPQAGFSKESLVLSLVSLLAFWLKSRRVTQTLPGIAALMLIATGVFYLLLDPTFLVGSVSVVLLEALYNVIIAVFLFEVCAWYQRKIVG